MKNLKKISLSNRTELLSDKEMKKIVGGGYSDRRFCCYPGGECLVEEGCTSDSHCDTGGWCY